MPLEEEPMQVLYERCAGLDVHKDTVVACVRVIEGGRVQQQVRTFGTVTNDLVSLGEWLEQAAVTHVAMEATGVYWKPVWHVLEEDFQLVLANAAHIKNVPGRKTDVNDAMWIADLLAHGLIRSSFVPERPVQELRDLMRTRKQLGRERTRHVQRIQKALEDANVKISSVISDITGKSGQAFLEAIIAGQTSAEELARLGDRRLKATPRQLVEALTGRITAHHRFMLKLHLDQVRSLDGAIAAVDVEVGRALEPFRHAIDLLDTIPGVDVIAADTIVSEIGFDMKRFPTAGHLLSWAGLCPRNDESAGKQRSTRIRKGDKWLKTTLVQAAWAAVNVKDSYLRALYYRLRARRGPKKAIIAVAASMLTAAYHMLRSDRAYVDLGTEHFDKIDRVRAKGRLVRRLENLGYTVKIEEATA
jgi:transposase